jgi:hypothetical protein
MQNMLLVLTHSSLWQYSVSYVIQLVTYMQETLTKMDYFYL